MDRNKSRRGCWTCKDRKIGCDRVIPTCRNCKRAGLKCDGYGFRLSWGRAGDRKRHIVNPKSTTTLPIAKGSLNLINTRYRDISTFYKYWNLDNYVLPKFSRLAPQLIPLSMFARVEHDEVALISYFQIVVVDLFSSVHDGKNKLRDTLLRMAFHGGGLSSLSVYRCIIALSSMRLYGSEDARAKSYYLDALSTLSKSIQRSSGTVENLQHTASSMLLNVYEVFDTLRQSPNWSYYFCGSKTIAKLIYKSGQVYSGDEADLLDWVYSHEALSKFSICHYAGRTTAQLICADDHFLKAKQSLSPRRQFITDVAGCSPELLEIMTELFTAVRMSNTTGIPSDHYKDTLKDIQLRLDSLQQNLRFSNARAPREIERLRLTAELYRVACLIYLERVGRGLSYWSIRVENLVLQGFSLLKALGSCERPFLLFVISCEARTEDQRLTVLEVISRTQKERNVGNLNLIKTMVEAAWVHEDLHVQEELPAVVKYNFIISACQTVPAFV